MNSCVTKARGNDSASGEGLQIGGKSTDGGGELGTTSRDDGKSPAWDLLLPVAELAVLAHEPAVGGLVLVVVTAEASGHVAGVAELIAVGSPRHVHLGEDVGAMPRAGVGIGRSKLPSTTW